MSIIRPTLAQLITRQVAAVNTRLPGAGAGSTNSVLGVLCRVQAGISHAQYGYIDYVSKQLFDDSADGINLERRAAIWGRYKLPAVKAVGAVICTGTEGAVISAGELLQTDGGVQYSVDTDVSIVGGSAVAQVTALLGAISGNQSAGLSLSFVSPLPNVDAAVVVGANGLAGGADIETDDSLRNRQIARMRAKAQGGNEADYIAWTKEAHPAVTRVWVTRPAGGIVVVRFVTDNEPTGILPTAGIIDTVDAYIQNKRPVAAEVNVMSPVGVALDLEIQLTPDTAATRAAVQASIAGLIATRAAPGATISIAHIREAISIADGEDDHLLISPVANISYAVGEIAVSGVITWS